MAASQESAGPTTPPISPPRTSMQTAIIAGKTCYVCGNMVHTDCLGGNMQHTDYLEQHSRKLREQRLWIGVSVKSISCAVFAIPPNERHRVTHAKHVALTRLAHIACIESHDSQSLMATGSRQSYSHCLPDICLTIRKGRTVPIHDHLLWRWPISSVKEWSLTLDSLHGLKDLS